MITFGIFGILTIAAFFLVIAGNVLRFWLFDVIAIMTSSVLAMAAWSIAMPVPDGLKTIGFGICVIVMALYIHHMCRKYPQVEMRAGKDNIGRTMHQWRRTRTKRAQVRRRIYTVETERV